MYWGDGQVQTGSRRRRLPFCFACGLLVLTQCLTMVQGFPVLSTAQKVASALSMAPDDPLVVVPQAQDALQSPVMARQLRKFRSSRGRSSPVLVGVSTVKKEKDGAAKETNDHDEPRTRGMVLPYETALAALRAYHAQHGDLVLPRRFTVPVDDDAYPRDWHGIDLSSTVYNMKWWQRHVKERPQRVAELGELGFVWERLQPEWNLILEALVTYKSIYGNLLVPNKLVVPRDATWPRATWGLALGNCVYRVRARNDFLRHNAASRRDQLDRLGFVWDVHEYSFQKFFDSLRHYAKLTDSGPYSPVGQTRAIRVPSTFVVPKTEEWPSGLWGYRLGEKCSAVRQKELYVKGKQRRKYLLNELGFRWGGNADLGWLKVVHAAAIYSRLHGRTLDVPYHFTVPLPSSREEEVDWPWPGHLWGFRLGQRLKDVRVKGAYVSGETGKARRRQLDALGFNWKPNRGRRKSS